MIIAVDFDGVIARTADFPAIGEMMPGAAEGITALRKAGNFVIVNTCRSNGDLVAAADWMREMGIQYDLINDNHPEMVKKYANNSRKVNADVYVDDRNLGGFPGWDSFEVRSLWDGEVKKYSAEFLVNTALRVCGEFGVTMLQLQSSTQKREVVEVRYMLFWYGKNRLKLVDRITGRIFGRDHATVLWGCKQVETWKLSDSGFREKFNHFKVLINDNAKV